MQEIRVTELVTTTPGTDGTIKARLANGEIIPIPASEEGRVKRAIERNQGKYSPQDVIDGPCGSSYVEVTEKPNDHPVRMDTGFEVDFPAVSYAWEVDISGPSYEDAYQSAGGLNLQTEWHGQDDSQYDERQGDYTAAVDPLMSFALLVTGNVCFSGGPTDDEFLTSPDTPVLHPLTVPNSDAAASPDAGTDNAHKETEGPLPSVTQTSRSGSSPADEGVSPLTVYPPDERTRVPDTTVYPYSAVGYVRTTFPDGGTGQCTAFLISPSVIATAGHCVYSMDKNAWATTIAFQAGRDAGRTPFGNCFGTTSYTVTGWQGQENERYDYGAVQLNCDIGNTVGWYGTSWTTESLTGLYVSTSGYPGDKEPIASQWVEFNKSILADDERQLYHRMDQAKGQSGSAQFAAGCSTYCAVSILARSQGAHHPNRNAATRISQAAFDNFVTWTPDHPG